jgi:hypothetical protein
MTEELRLKTEQKPSIFNKDMLLGGLIGASIPLIGFSIAVAAPIGLGLTAAGALIGGAVGKTRQEEENKNGKPVGKPSFWNKDTAIGTLIGYQATVAVLAIAGLASIAAGMGIGMIAPPAGAAVMGIGLILSVAAAIASPFVGGYLGGKSGEKRMEREYEQAKQQHIVTQLSQNVSPEIGQAVEYAMEHKKDWGKTELEKKLMAAAQGQQPGRRD